MSDIGEKAFLRHLLPQLKATSIFINGFGHDSSVLDLGLDQYLAFKIDRAPTPIALSRGWSDYRTWGRLAVAANVSDLIASAAIPRALMLSLVLPRNFDSRAAEEIVTGCQESCEQHGVAFVGGDTKEGPAVQVVGAAIGTVDKRYYLGRVPASPGDHLVVAGPLGGFAGALIHMDKGVANEELRRNLLLTLTMPTARISEGAYLRESRLAHGSCDLSDGLADALEVFCSDAVGITIDASAFPLHEHAIAAAHSLGIDPYNLAFSVGDWALACLVSKSNVSRFFDEAPAGLMLFDLGKFDDTGQRCVRSQDGIVRKAPTLVNEHFRRRLEDGENYLDALISAAD